MVAEMIEKPLTEAQRLVERLESEFALSPAEIAQQTKIKAQTIHDIKRRTNTGNLQLRFLRPLIRALESNGNPLENAGRSDPVFSNPTPSHPEPLAEPVAAGFDLNADEPAPAPKRGLFDGLRAAMLGDSSQPSLPSMSAPSRRKNDKNDKGDDPKEDFVAKMTPIAALLFVIAVRSRIHDPYKPVAPQPNEMRDIIEPWMTWMAKQLDIRGKLTEDANIVLASLLATGLYGVRAFETYQAIHAEEVQRARSDRQPSGAEYLAASGGGGARGNAAAASADAGAGRGIPDANAPLPFWRGNAGTTRQAFGATGRQPSREPASPEQRRADASIDALLAADHAGRLRLGL